MTALLAEVSQLSQGLSWVEGADRVEKFAIECVEGYRILATSVKGQWSYTAFGPVEKIIQDGDRVYFRDFEYKATYERGEVVPPSYGFKNKSARYLIGGFNAEHYGSVEAALEAAKTACFEDYQIQQKKNGSRYD